MSDGVAFDVDTASLRSVLQALKSIDPKLATNLRRELRDAGDDIIAAQRAELTERAPKVAGRSESWRLIVPKRDKNGRTRKPYLARRVTYHAGETRQGGDSDLRQQISRGLRTRVLTGAKSAAAVTLKDGTVLALGPDSSVDLASFQFDPTTQGGNMLVNLARGTLRVVTGIIAKVQPEQVKVTTPTTVIGVRGTDFIVEENL